MTVIQVKNSIVYDAIQATDPEAEETALQWFRAQHPEEDSVEATVDMTGPRELQLWLLRHPTGPVMLVPAADFITDFEEVDAVAEFAAVLDKTPTATVADDPDDRKQAQAQVDAFVAERVRSMLDEFEELLASAQDIDADAQEGVQWAYERFKKVFGVTEA